MSFVKSTLLTACLCLFQFLLSGCASLPEILGGRADIEFELEGRAAVRYGEEGGSTRISWRHGASSDDVLITGPLGQGIARIVRRGGEASLTTAEGKEYRAGDAESLTESVLGWRLPLTGMPDWVRGRASVGRAAQVERDEIGQVKEVKQDDWRIEYLAWNDALPSRMTLSHEGARGRVELRIIIDQWKKAPQ